MVDVHVSFYDKGFALADEDKAKEHIKQLKGVPAWKVGYIKDRYCYRTVIIYEVHYETKEEYEKNYQILNEDFVKGLKLLGYKDEDFENVKKKLTVSVISYNKPGLFKEWHEKRHAK